MVNPVSVEYFRHSCLKSETLDMWSKMFELS